MYRTHSEIISGLVNEYLGSYVPLHISVEYYDRIPTVFSVVRKNEQVMVYNRTDMNGCYMYPLLEFVNKWTNPLFINDVLKIKHPSVDGVMLEHSLSATFVSVHDENDIYSTLKLYIENMINVMEKPHL